MTLFVLSQPLPHGKRNQVTFFLSCIKHLTSHTCIKYFFYDNSGPFVTEFESSQATDKKRTVYQMALSKRVDRFEQNM